MNPDPEKYLLPLDDGLPMRPSQSYAKDKLYALEAYLKIAQTAMKNQPWLANNYIDLQAGPGKNLIDGQVYLGSPLIALDIKPEFTHFWFNELQDFEHTTLEKRTQKSALYSKISLTKMDVNDAVDIVFSSIYEADMNAKSKRKPPTFNIAFLDPEGLEIKWSTVSKLANLDKMDLIINFSTSGINRNLHQPESIDTYFGNQQWRELGSTGDHIQRRRQLINLYRQQLKSMGYAILNDDEIGHHDISMKNSKNAEVYSLIFASKNPLGEKLWWQVKKEIERLRHRGNLLL